MFDNAALRLAEQFLAGAIEGRRQRGKAQSRNYEWVVAERLPNLIHRKWIRQRRGGEKVRVQIEIQVPHIRVQFVDCSRYRAADLREIRKTHR